MAKMNMPDKAYGTLIDDLLSIRHETEAAGLTAVQIVAVMGYWRMGRRLCEEHIFKAGGKSKVKRSLLTHIARDVRLEYSFLTRIIKFYRTWPNECPAKYYPKINWSHYRTLLTVSDARERQFYLEEANNNRWNLRKLRAKIKSDSFKREQEAAALAQGKEEGAVAVQMLPNKETEEPFLYKAAIERVVDGDTIILNIDLGFDVWRRQRIRLRGIDTPELDTPEGKQAMEFVLKELRQVARVCIRTYKVDIYGRYVCDLFYLLGVNDKGRIFREGKFLNQELVNNGLAELV
ncbi:MAG: thermonuclease family protein [Candidatus Omnitrophica bacterium]|nr:thermonuclease family protein [Candidatus Omnitrophota bacterium]